MVEKEKAQYEGQHTRLLILGVGLCILAAVPLFVAAAVVEDGMLLIAAVDLLLLLVAAGVFLLVKDLHPLRGLPTPPGGGGLPPGQEAGGPAQRGGEHHLLVRRHRRLPGLELPLRGLAHHLGGLAGGRGVLGGDRRHPLPGAAVPFQVLTPVRPLNANTPPAGPVGCSYVIRACSLLSPLCLGRVLPFLHCLKQVYSNRCVTIGAYLLSCGILIMHNSPLPLPSRFH